VSSAQSPITQSQAANPRDRRSWERYLLHEAEGKLIYGSATLRCQFIDVSLGGCRLRTEQRFSAGALAKVDVVLQIHGITQRMSGITQWTGKGNMIGVRFVHASPQTKNQFAALLTCLVDKEAAETILETVASTGTVAAAVPGTRSPAPPASSVQPAQDSKPDVPHAAPHAVEVAPKESEASIRLLKDGTYMAGTVVDLSLESCTLRMERPFTLGIYIRVEMSFHVRGLTFQLAAVSREILDKHTVEFRFLDVSKRKQEELAQVIEEIRVEKERLAGQP
jgi:c-di-GMP-binding flagellar brake protein YcgR